MNIQSESTERPILNSLDKNQQSKCKIKDNDLSQNEIKPSPLNDQTNLIKIPHPMGLNDNHYAKCEFAKTDQGKTERSEKDPSRYVSKKLKYKIWQKNHKKCCNCNSKVNLQLDHIKPYALSGKTSEENLRLLCFNCNQRKRIEACL